MKAAQLSPTLCDPLDCTPRGSSSMEFSRQEYWSKLPFPSQGIFPTQGSEPRSPALKADSLPAEPQGKPALINVFIKSYIICSNSVNFKINEITCQFFMF